MEGLDKDSLVELRGDLRQLLSDALDARRFASGDAIGVAYNSGKSDAFRHALGVIEAIVKDQSFRERAGA